MSSDNQQEDGSVEIDFGGIGRRIGGFFGRKKPGKDGEGSARPEKEGSEKPAGSDEAAEKSGADGEEQGETPGEEEGAGKSAFSEAREEKKAEGAGKSASSEVGKTEKSAYSESKKAEKSASSEADKEQGGALNGGSEAEKGDVTGTDDDYFELDLGGLFGRKKKDGPGAAKKHAGEGALEKPGEEGGELPENEAEPDEKEEGRKVAGEKKESEKAAGEKRGVEAAGEKKEADTVEEEKGDDGIEIDFGKIFGRKKEAEKEAGRDKGTHEEEKEVTVPAEGKVSDKNEAKEDDGIEIDFGKIFGRKNAAEHPENKDREAHAHKHHKDAGKKEGEAAGEKKEDAVEIDFGRIGSSLSGVFGGGKSADDAKKERKETQEEEEYLRTVELDIDSIGKKLIQHRKLVVFVLLAAVVSFSLYIRLLSAGSPLSSDPDTYLHYRYAREILDNNMQLPSWDEKSYYPPGRIIAEAGGYPLMEVYLYKFLLNIYPDITLITAAMLLTALFGGLATIPAFFIGRDASGEMGGLFSAFLVGTIPAILVRSVGSYADTDAMVLFFSLLIVALYMKAVESAKDRLNVPLLAYSVSAALTAVAFVYVWGATFEYIVQLLVPLPFVLLAIYLLSGKGGLSKRVRYGFGKTRYVFLAMLVLLMVPPFVSGIYNLDESGHYVYKGLGIGFVSLKGFLLETVQKFTNPLGVAEMKSESGGVGGTGRNVYISVAEMQPPGLDAYTSQFGSVAIGGYNLFSFIYLPLLFFVLGASLLVYKFVPEKSHAALTYVLSAILIFAGLAMTRLGIMTPEMRVFLAKFLVVVGSFFFIAGLLKKSGALGRMAHVFFENELQERALLIVLVWGSGLFFISTLGIRFLALLGPPLCISAGVLLDRTVRSFSLLYQKLSPVILGFAVVLLVLLFAPSAYSIGSSAAGSMDPQWHDMLVWINLNSAPDATVTTWWDPGHWVTAIADRRSGADGAHYPGGPMPISRRIHDFGLSFSTTNESESVETLRPYLGNASEMFYISSSDLIGKFVWLSYFSTGVKQQYIILGERGAYPQNGATLHMYPLSENVVIVVKESGTELEPWLYVNNNKLRIKEITYFDQNGNVEKRSYKDGEDAMVWMQGDKKVLVYMPGSVKDNILTRTYFFGGEGLESFKLEFANPQIKLYKVKF